MIGVHLLSEEVVKWCRFQNEIIGVHLLLVGTSSVLVCMTGVRLQMMMVKQLKCLGFIKINYFLS